MNNFKLSIAFLVTFFMSLVGFSQCTTTNFTVTKVNGTCFSNGSITVTVPTSTDCSAWVAVISRPADGFSTQLNIPNIGGSVTFTSLPPGNYNVSLSNGFTTLNYASNPVVVSTSYVNMSISATSNPPTCQNSAPGYAPNGTLTITVANGTGIGPFVYTLTASNGTQTATSSNRVYTFLNVPGGEVVGISVTDQAGGSPGCSVTSTQSPTTATNTAAILAFNDRPFNYERDCSNPTSSCNNVNLFVNIKNLNATKLAIVQQPGNATITIAGNTYNLTYLSGSARFKYDPLATGGPQLVNGTVITTTFFDGCNTISKTSTVQMNDTFLSANPTTLTNTSNCTVSYRIQLLGDQDVSGGNGFVDRAVYFCQQNTILFERRISTSPDVWQAVPSTDITPNPSASTNPLGVNIGVAIPSAGTNFFVNQPGVYRVTVSDACHSVVRTVTVTSTNPFTNVSAAQTTSVLQGTSAIKVSFSGLPPLTSPVKVKITRVDGQTSMTINPTQPAYLAGTYTINFPIERSVGYPVNATYIQDLPLGQYIVELSDGCSASTGFTKTINVNLTNAVSYNPQFSVTTGCIGSNSISYNMNPVNSPNSDNQVRLYTANSNGSLGTYLQISPSGSLSGSFLNLNSGNYYIQFGNIKSEAMGGGAFYSAAMNNMGPWQYLVPITIQPYQDITVATVTSFCDIGDTNSGIILAQVTGGNIVYPITFQLFSVSDPSTPLQSGTFQSLVDAVAFEDLSVGDYFVRVITACYSVDTNVTLSTSGTVPQAEVSNPVICPGSPTTVAIIAASQNLFDVTWSANGQVVGTGMPITLAPTVTTTYTATYTLKSIYGCANSPVYTSNVTVTVTPNPNLGLAVSDINLCDGSAPSVTISNTQSEFTYEIVSSTGTSFSPPLIVNGNGGSLTVAIPNTITLTAGQILKVKSTNGNAGCTGLLTDVCNVLNGIFNITCPTFPSTSVQCYADLPSQTSYTISQFQALGNGNGIVDVVGCGVVEITASNGVNPGCNANAIRTYTITEYADPNNNDIRDAGENTILHTTNCTQTININDTTAPTITGTLSGLNVSGLQPLITNAIALSTTNQVVVNSLSTLDFLTVTGGEMYGPSIVSSPVNASVAKLNNNQWIFACWNGSGVLYTKMVLVEFSIISGQLHAKIVQSKYTTSNSVSSAASILAAWNASSTTTSPSVNAYGVRFVTLSSLACDVLSSPTAMTTVAALEAAGLAISDNCTTDANLVVTSSDGTAIGTCPVTFTRTYTITDACNNTNTATQTININDTTAPIVTGTLTASNTTGCSIAAAPSAMTTVTALETAGLTISDNCTTDANLVVTSSDGTATGTCPITFTRTYTITDACNNTTTVTQTININDTTAPVVIGTLSASITNGCSIAAAPSAMTTVTALETAGLTISDNCTADANLVVTSSDGTATGTCPITFTRTYTITDACNNANTVTQTVNINDTIAPVITGTLTASNTNGCSITDASIAMTSVSQLEAAGLTISDNCTTDANLVVTSSDGTATGTCPITFTRTYTITDACNNATTATQTININDTIAPVITGTLTASNTDGCSIAAAPAAMTTVTALETAGLTISDNCTADANLVVTSSDGTATGTCPITFTRTYTITDACNNATTVTQTININDTTAPVVTGTLTASNTTGCSIAAAPSAMTTVTALEAAGLTISDNCTADANLVVTSSDGTATGTCPITFTRTYTITDACNNATTVTQIININDTTAPVVTGTLTASNTDGCSIADSSAALTTVAALEAAGLTISDNCTADANLVVTSSDGTATGTCPITFTRTYTITDACNNATTVTQTININDTTAPVVTGTLTASNTTGCSIAAAPSAMTTVTALEAAGLTISDNCTADANLVVTSSDGTATGTCPITFTRTYTITDACNNATTTTQTININDTTAPVVTGTLTASNTTGCSIAAAPSAMTTVTALETAGLSISDNCTADANLVVTSSDGTSTGTCPITFTRTYTIKDTCNNATTVTQIININDTTAPVVTGTLTAVNETGCSIAAAPSAMITVTALETAGLTISDNCTADANLVVTSSDGTATGTCPITFTRTYTIKDACNNATTVTQIVNINDTTAPVVTGTLTAVNETGCSIAAAPSAMTTITALEAAGLTISDNCITDANLVVTSSDGTATGTCPITFTRTYTVKDACNNATTVTQIININDTTAPVVTGTLTASNTDGCSIAAAPSAMTTVTALETAGLTISDNCTADANLVVTSSDGTATGTCPITFTRTYTIKDVCNNATTVTQIININDTTAPVVTGTLTASNTDGCSIAAAPSAMTTVTALEAAGLSISDNCTADANLVVTSSDGTATGTCPITFTRTYTIKDACNNATTVTQTITVQDITAPIFSGTVPQDITLECNQTIPSAATVTATDNCNGLVTINFTEQNQPGTCQNNYSITRTWVATDVCGNSQTHTQQITIQDTTPPVFVGNLPSNEVFAKCDGIPVAPVLTATDNCGSATVTYTEVKIDGDCTNKYRLERTWTATDSCGNESQIIQTVYLACYVTPYNALSPDGDGLNDTFIIEGLECYPNNSVEIYNRWGVMVFEATYYDNVNNVFKGFSDGRSTVSRNDKLPTGDYWYVLKYEYDLYGRTKENIEKIGYIYIQNE